MRLRFAFLLLVLMAPALYAQGGPRGVQLFQSGDWAKARTEFTAAVRRNDKDALAHYYLGRLAWVENDLDAAVEQFERAVKLDDNTSDYHLWCAKALGLQAIRTTNPLLGGRIKSEYERAVALNARNIDARDGLLDFYSMAPAMMGGSADKAREQADAIGKVDAMRGHVALGRMAMRAKDGPAVEREMNAAIAAAPDSLRGYSALASWYMSTKEWPQAFATLDRYLQQRPADPYGPYTIGRIAAAAGQQLERGEQGLRAFLAKPPKTAAPPVLSRAYLLLGQVLQHKGAQAEARSAFEQAARLDPHSDEAKKALDSHATNR